MLPGTKIRIDWEAEQYSSYSNGSNSGLLFDNLSGSCLTDLPSQCTNGFSIAFWIKWVEWKPSFVISSPWFNWKHFMEQTVPVEVWDGTTAWRMFFERDLNKEKNSWMHYVITWSRTKEIKIFVDGVDKSTPNLQVPIAMHLAGKDMKPGRLALGTSAEKIRSDDETPLIWLRRFSLWNKWLTSEQIQTIYNIESEFSCKMFNYNFSVNCWPL